MCDGGRAPVDVVDDRTATETGPVLDHAVAGAGPRSTSTRLGGASLEHTVTEAGPTLDHTVMEAVLHALLPLLSTRM